MNYSSMNTACQPPNALSPAGAAQLLSSELREIKRTLKWIEGHNLKKSGANKRCKKHREVLQKVEGVAIAPGTITKINYYIHPPDGSLLGPFATKGEALESAESYFGFQVSEGWEEEGACGPSDKEKAHKLMEKVDRLLCRM